MGYFSIFFPEFSKRHKQGKEDNPSTTILELNIIRLQRVEVLANCKPSFIAKRNESESSGMNESCVNGHIYAENRLWTRFLHGDSESAECNV